MDLGCQVELPGGSNAKLAAGTGACEQRPWAAGLWRVDFVWLWALRRRAPEGRGVHQAAEVVWGFLLQGLCSGRLEPQSFLLWDRHLSPWRRPEMPLGQAPQGSGMLVSSMIPWSPLFWWSFMRNWVMVISHQTDLGSLNFCNVMLYLLPMIKCRCLLIETLVGIMCHKYGPLTTLLFSLWKGNEE